MTVVPFERPAPVRTREPARGKRWCGHQQTELDTDARRVYCRECKTELDPFTVLVNLARHFERWESAAVAARDAARAAEKRLKELRREEGNAKARKRRRDAKAT